MKKFGLITWAKSNRSFFKILSYIVNFIAVVVMMLWLFKVKYYYSDILDIEALFAFTSGVAVILNQIHRKLLEESEFSPSHILAYGYVKNFLQPVIMQLKSSVNIKPKICIYKPSKISELFESNIDMMKTDLTNKNYTLTEVKLDLKQGRARDVLTIQHSGGKATYFDFPNTLLSLLTYIDYKVESKAYASSDIEKDKLALKLVNEFYEKVDELAIDYRIKDNITYCDSKLKIF